MMCSTHGLFPDEADCICDALTSHRRECGRASDVEIEGLRGKVGRIGRVSEWRLMCEKEDITDTVCNCDHPVAHRNECPRSTEVEIDDRESLINFISKYKGKKVIVSDDIGWGKTEVIGDIIFLASEFETSDIDELYITKTKKFDFKLFEYTFLHLAHEKWGNYIKELYESTKPSWGGAFVRQKHFMTMNRYAKSHRLLLYYNLYKDSLLDKGYCSFLQKRNYRKKIQELYKFNESESELLDTAMNKLPMSLDGDINTYRLSVLDPLSPNLALFFNSYFSVVTESEYASQHFHFSEKMGKVLMSFHPFIVFANPFYLEVLKDFGFKTFHKVHDVNSGILIDESYDKEMDELKRFEMTYQQVKYLCSFSLNELHSWYHSLHISNILIHNFEHIKNISDKNINYLNKLLS